MNDWKARAEREAAAILAGMRYGRMDEDYEDALTAASLAWLQGAIFASHMDLQALEEGVDAVRAAR